MRNPFERPGLVSPSFVDALRAYAPELLEVRTAGGTVPEVPHGTTVAALRFADGVAMGGDRRATEGMNIAQRDIEKVFPADDFSAVAIAGAAGPAIEMVRLFQTELEHYEKIEGFPLFCGYDTRRQAGRIFRYDVTGGRWEDADYHATGSGGRDARGSLKKRWRPDIDGDTAVEVLVEALYDAADEDAATGGPDLVRGIFPVVATVTDQGYRRVPDEDLRKAAERVVAARARGEG
jgi:proteasome beta subunit